MTARAIGIDIGGSSIKIGLVDGDGAIVDRRPLDWDARETYEALVVRVVDAARDLAAGDFTCLAGIGIATPGFCDPDTGIIVDGAHNVASLADRAIDRSLADATGCPTLVENDGIAATLGELHFGAGRDAGNFALLTLGTGVGGGIVIDGRIIKGRRGEPPELGAMVLDAAGPKNYSGLPGTLEYYASRSGFLKAFRAEGLAGETLEDHFAQASAGHPAARAGLRKTAARIAQACGTLINALNLDACLLGGGIAAAGPVLLEAVQAELPTATWPLLLGKAEIRLASRGNDAGTIGAVAHFFHPPRFTRQAEG